MLFRVFQDDIKSYRQFSAGMMLTYDSPDYLASFVREQIEEFESKNCFTMVILFSSSEVNEVNLIVQNKEMKYIRTLHIHSIVSIIYSKIFLWPPPCVISIFIVLL